MQEGRLDRNRVLDAVLAAPLRDWAAADLGWYVGMHDALELTVDEAADRVDLGVLEDVVAEAHDELPRLPPSLPREQPSTLVMAMISIPLIIGLSATWPR